MKKPRVRFCWECGKKLYGNHFAEVEIDGHKRILHKRCNEYLESPHYDIDWQEEAAQGSDDWK